MLGGAESQEREITPEMLRSILIDYYGTAMQQNSMAVVDLANVENLDMDELIEEAQNAGLI